MNKKDKYKDIWDFEQWKKKYVPPIPPSPPPKPQPVSTPDMWTTKAYDEDPFESVEEETNSCLWCDDEQEACDEYCAHCGAHYQCGLPQEYHGSCETALGRKLRELEAMIPKCACGRPAECQECAQI